MSFVLSFQLRCKGKHFFLNMQINLQFFVFWHLFKSQMPYKAPKKIKMKNEKLKINKF